MLRLSPLQSTLLGIVAAHGPIGVSRSRLLSLLWSLGTDSRLRHRLSQLVYSFRRKLPGKTPILAVGDYCLLNSQLVSSDLDSLSVALGRRAIRTAMVIVRKGFFSNLARSPTAELERWIQERESSFRAEVRTSAATTLREAEETSDWPVAEEAAEVLLQIDPRSERVLRSLLKARALLGKPHEADATFAEFRDQIGPHSAWATHRRTWLRARSPSDSSLRFQRSRRGYRSAPFWCSWLPFRRLVTDLRRRNQSHRPMSTGHRSLSLDLIRWRRRGLSSNSMVPAHQTQTGMS